MLLTSSHFIFLYLSHVYKVPRIHLCYWHLPTSTLSTSATYTQYPGHIYVIGIFLLHLSLPQSRVHCTQDTFMLLTSSHFIFSTSVTWTQYPGHIYVIDIFPLHLSLPQSRVHSTQDTLILLTSSHFNFLYLSHVYTVPRTHLCYWYLPTSSFFTWITCTQYPGHIYVIDIFLLHLSLPQSRVHCTQDTFMLLTSSHFIFLYLSHVYTVTMTHLWYWHFPTSSFSTSITCTQHPGHIYVIDIFPLHLSLPQSRVHSTQDTFMLLTSSHFIFLFLSHVYTVPRTHLCYWHLPTSSFSTSVTCTQ